MTTTPAKPASPHSLAAAGGLDVVAVRADFPILDRRVHGRPLVYLDNAATTHKPRAVLDCVQSFYRESNSSVHRGVHQLSEQASAAYEAARARVQRFINAREAAEVVFTHGATEAINLVADGLAETLTGDHDVIVTEMEHHSNLLPWQVLCRRTGARLHVVPFREDGTLELDAFAGLLTDRTRLVALTHVSNVLGVVNPVREVVALAHARDVPVLVDGAQSVPHLPVDVQALDCDFLACSGHKMYAETGIGVLYGKREWLERLTPGRVGGGMVQSVRTHDATYADLPLRFEAGTPNIAGALSLAAAIDYLDALGLDAVAAHERRLMEQAVAQLTEIAGVRLYGPRVDRCGALSFNIAEAGGYDVALILDKLGVAVRSGTHCAEPLLRRYGTAGAVRASFAVYNSTEEVDRFAEGVAKARSMLS